jgi:hypothetical protein
MPDWIIKLLDLLNRTTKLVLILWLVSLTIILSPPKWLAVLYIEKIKDEYGIYIGITFIFTTVMLILELLFMLWNKIKAIRLEKLHAKKMLKELQQLDPQEKELLQAWLNQNENTLYLGISNPTVRGLIEKGILEQFGSITDKMIGGERRYFCKISPKIKEHLQHFFNKSK